ncbi:MAG: DnaD domain protein [Firmicutes bacterium]|nr:DnaD domain protein [Bacillota bacterium]
MVNESPRAWRVDSPRWMISVPRELLTVYHKVIGCEAVLVWLHLQCWGDAKEAPNLDTLISELQTQTGFQPDTITLALHKLEQFELVRMDERVIRLRLPLSEEQFSLRFASALKSESPQEAMEAADFTLDDVVETVSAAPAANAVPNSEDNAPLNEDIFASPEADLEAVLDLYHKRIGLMGPKQRDILRYWVEESGMSAEVVAAAIDITARQAENPRVPYLVGVLRNWYNDGVRTYDDAVKKYPEITGTKAPSKRVYEGLPNAGAYVEGDSELVRKWKELYPDEYNS